MRIFLEEYMIREDGTKRLIKFSRLDNIKTMYCSIEDDNFLIEFKDENNFLHGFYTKDQDDIDILKEAIKNDITLTIITKLKPIERTPWLDCYRNEDISHLEK